MNRQRYRFLRRFPRPWTVINGPAKLTADLANARSNVFNLAVGNGYLSTLFVDTALKSVGGILRTLFPILELPPGLRGSNI